MMPTFVPALPPAAAAVGAGQRMASQLQLFSMYSGGAHGGGAGAGGSDGGGSGAGGGMGEGGT